MNENLYTPNSVRTISGNYVNFVTPKPETIQPIDIAHSLSQKPRWNGQLSEFYSVAQHCCIACDLVPVGYKADALMHDSSEAYMADVPSPLKKLLPQYKRIENRLMKVIYKKYGIPYPISNWVKEIDRHLLQLEWQCLMLDRTNFPHRLWTPAEAKQEFLFRFRKYVLA